MTRLRCPTCDGRSWIEVADDFDLDAAVERVRVQCRERAFRIIVVGDDKAECVRKAHAAELVDKKPSTLRNWRGQLDFRRVGGRRYATLVSIAKYLG